jgi:uncharacterized membrane protein YecN with MAPEG domain
MYVTAIFSTILAFIFIRLTFHVIELRKLHKVAFGHGGVDSLEKAIRAHGNFSEYVPISLILMGTLEFNGAPSFWIVILGAFFVLGRYFHARGMNHDGPDFENRVTGMKFTLVTVALLALSNVIWIAYVLLAAAKFAAMH